MINPEWVNHSQPFILNHSVSAIQSELISQNKPEPSAWLSQVDHLP